MATERDDTGVSAVAGRKPWSTRRKVVVGLLVSGAAAGFIWLVTLSTVPAVKDRSADNGSGNHVGEVGEDWSPVPRKPPVVPVANRLGGAPPPPPGVTTYTAVDPGPPARLSIVAFQMGRSAAPPASAGAGAGDGSVAQVSYGTAGRPGTQREGALSDQTSVATMLPDRNLFITMGTPMACTPEQPINTDQPGPFRCKIKVPVRSTSSNVALFDDGTWLVGEISSDLGRGKRRAYAVMHRAETPQGCIVSFRNPVGDPLGQAGLDGEVDDHFFERFKGYAMIALLDAASQGAALLASNALASHSGNSVQFNQVQGIGSQLGQGSYGDDVNIPNTLYRPQAKPIVVIAASDIDMRACFRLVSR